MLANMRSLNWKQFIGVHSFEVAYLVVLAVLPFIVAIRVVATFIFLVLGLLGLSSLIRRFTHKTIDVDGQGVVITGCDTGFGHSLVKRLDRLGFTVIAGCLDDQGEGADKLRKWSETGRIHVIRLDVTSDTDVQNAVEFAKKHCKNGVWGVVNNAALNYVAHTEFCSMDQYHKIAEVNQFGVIRVTKAFLPLIRQSKGRIVNVTSAKGKLCLPFNAAYGCAKYAVEAFSDVLRLEMFKFGVNVVIVEPGDFGGTTGMLSAKTLKWLQGEMNTMWTQASEEQKKTYGKTYFDALYTGTTEAAKDAAKSMAPVIDAMEDALTNVAPQIRYLVDGSSKLIDVNNMLIRLRSYIPDSWLDFLVDRVHNSGFPDIQAQTNN